MMLIPSLNKDLDFFVSVRHPVNLMGILCYSLNNGCYYLIKPPIYGRYDYELHASY